MGCKDEAAYRHHQGVSVEILRSASKALRLLPLPSRLGSQLPAVTSIRLPHTDIFSHTSLLTIPHLANLSSTEGEGLVMPIHDLEAGRFLNSSSAHPTENSPENTAASQVDRDLNDAFSTTLCLALATRSGSRL